MPADPNSTHRVKLSAGLCLLLWMTLFPGASLVSHACSFWRSHFSLSWPSPFLNPREAITTPALTFPSYTHTLLLRPEKVSVAWGRGTFSSLETSPSVSHLHCLASSSIQSIFFGGGWGTASTISTTWLISHLTRFRKSSFIHPISGLGAHLAWFHGLAHPSTRHMKSCGLLVWWFFYLEGGYSGN